MKSAASPLLTPPFLSVTPPLSSEPAGCPSFWPRKRLYSERRESESHLALSSGAPMASKSAGEPELWSPLSLPAGTGSHAVGREGEGGVRRKGLNVVVGAEAGMCPLYLCPFVGHDG